MPRRIVVGITGASGAAYSARLLEVLLWSGCQVHLSISSSGQMLLKHELGVDADLMNFDVGSLLAAIGADERAAAERPWRLAPLPASPAAGRVVYHHHQDFMAPIASGSFRTDGMAVCPCSGSTLSAIACGASNNLVQRAADVHLKERRKLVLVPRETPLSLIQIDNMRRCAEAGAVLLPAMPGFYQQPRSIGDLVDFVVSRVCDQLGVEHPLAPRWGE